MIFIFKCHIEIEIINFMMKRFIFIIFILYFFQSTFAQIDDNNFILKLTYSSVTFCRNDSVFKARVYVNDYNSIDSIKVGFIQKSLRPKKSKLICNYARFRKRIPSKVFRKIKNEVQAEFQCRLTGIYTTTRCNDNAKEIYFFGMCFSFKNNGIP